MKNKICIVISLLLIVIICTGCLETDIPLDNDLTTNANTTDTLSPETLLNGIDISKYTIVYSDSDHDYSARAAKYIQSEIKARTGIELTINTDTVSPSGEYEIVVGETSRDISSHLDANTENVQFTILAEENKIALEGDYFVIAAAAYYFINTYITNINIRLFN